jgi:hypothetical protein
MTCMTCPSARIVLGCVGVVWLGGFVGCSEPEATPPAKPPVEIRKTPGKTTQKVLDLEAAIADGGVVVASGETREGLDAITGAHRSASAQIGAIQVEQAVRLHAAEHGQRPATHAEFMAAIIRPGEPDGIQLPMLPYYQEYAFDPGKGSVVVVEFPALREQREKETTGAAGL